MNKEFSNDDITGKVIGCAMKVHSALRNGFPEIIYQRALAIELTENGIEFQLEKEMPVFYKNIEVGIRRVDIFVNNCLPVELKATSLLEDSHLAQAINYLEAFDLQTGLLINFGSKSLQFHRLTNKKYKPQKPH